MEIKSETIKIIKLKVGLFDKKNYFKAFKDIFLNLSMEYINNKNKNNSFSESKNKENNSDVENNKDISIENYNKSSLWFKIMQNIFTKKEVKDYKIINKKEDNNNQIEKNERERNHVFFKKHKTKYEISNLAYSYLYHLSQIKLEKLIMISKKEKMTLVIIIKIYLGLCSQHLGLIKIDSETETINENKFNRKNYFKMLTIKNEYKEKVLKRNIHLKEKSPKNNGGINNAYSKTNNENYNSNFYLSKYASNWKKRLAMKYMKAKSQPNKDNINKKKEIKKNKSIYKEEEGDEEEEEKDKNNLYSDIVDKEFIESLYNLNQKNKNNSSKFLYAASFTRLFIGETDLKSIMERYNSNVNVKKEQKLKKKSKNKKSNLSRAYLKMFLNKVSQIKKSKLPIIEKNIEGVLKKYKKNQEIIDKFKKIPLKEEYLCEEQKNNKTINKENDILSKNEISENVIKIDNLDTNQNYKTLENQKITKDENIIPPLIKNQNKSKATIRTNLSFNKQNRENLFRNSNNDENMKKKNIQNRVGSNRNIFTLQLTDKMNQNKECKTILNDRDNLARNHFINIFEKKINKNEDKNTNNKLNLNQKLNLTYKRERNNHRKLILNEKNNEVKYFLTKKDFFYEDM